MQTFEKILKIIDQSTTSFQGSVPDIQKQIYGDLQEYIKKLDLKDGKIMNNLQNLQLIGQIKNKLKKILSGKEYNKLVGDFTQAFDEVAKLNQQYFADFNFKFKPKKTLPVIKQLAIDQTIEDLIGQGMAESIIKPITEILKSNITTGGSYAKFQEQLRTHIVNDENGAGSLQRYTKQITTDAINQFNAQYHDSIAQDLQFNWGQYVGSNLTTTREFCERLTGKEWVHRTELPGIIKGKIDGVDIKLSKTTGLPIGMIPGTNVDNFKVNRGGYQCGHQFFWVPDSAVPESVRKKFENKGKPLQSNFYDTKKNEINKNFSSEQESKIVKDSGLSYDNIVSLTGGIPKEKITRINHNLYERSDISIQSTVVTDQYNIVRIIHHKDKWIYNDYMRVNDKNEKGIGLNLFLNQVKEARSLGFNYLKVTAAGSYNSKDDWNGYQTWAKFGYIMEPGDQLRFLKLMSDNNRNEKNVFELVSSKEGADFWERNGSQWAGKFDLKDNSQAIKNLKKYLADRDINFEL